MEDPAQPENLYTYRQGTDTLKLENSLVSINEYRLLLNDSRSSDQQIQTRIEYLESLFRNIIKNEIKTYVEKSAHNHS